MKLVIFILFLLIPLPLNAAWVMYSGEADFCKEIGDSASCVPREVFVKMNSVTGKAFYLKTYSDKNGKWTTSWVEIR